MAQLVLVRHGTSEYNKLGLWTGLTDVDLAEEGREDARRAAQALRDIPIHRAHVSALKRTHQTLEEMKKVLGLVVEHNVHAALNERDYGVHTGKNKWEVRAAVGEEEFHNIRRGWDAVVLGGENLKDVHARVVPYFEAHILPELREGHNVLVVAHGNSLRALIKHLERIADDKIHEYEVDFGEVHCYEFDERGDIREKLVRTTGSLPE